MVYLDFFPTILVSFPITDFCFSVFLSTFSLTVLIWAPCASNCWPMSCAQPRCAQAPTPQHGGDRKGGEGQTQGAYHRHAVQARDQGAHLVQIFIHLHTTARGSERVLGVARASHSKGAGDTHLLHVILRLLVALAVCAARKT